MPFAPHLHYDELWQAVGHVCDLFTEEECFNFFKAAGYGGIKRDVLKLAEDIEKAG